MPPFGTGAIKDRPDARDYQWAEIGFGSLPFDWSTGFDIEATLSSTLGIPGFKLPVKNQGASGSCGGQAWSYQNEVLEAIFSKTFEERSAKYIYEQTYVYPAGSAGRDNATILIKQGDAQESLLSSYEQGAPPSEWYMQKMTINDSMRLDAKKSRLLSYANVALDIDTVAQAIRDNSGVVLGITGTNNGSWFSSMPVPPINTPPGSRWYHWIYAGKAKIINGKKYVGFLNSWGSAIGESGWQWISEDYFNCMTLDDYHGQSAVWSAWTHVFNTAPEPTFSHNFAVEIRFGSSGAEVVALQKALQLDGEFPATVPTTGYYGDITRRAVLAFQVKYQVAPMNELSSLNGKLVGTKTRAKLNQLFNK